MDKENWKKIVESYTEIIQPGIDELKERLKSEKPEKGYKSIDDIQPETLERLKSLKEFCDIFGIPFKEHFKDVL
jgi:hypothetical protein